MSDRQILVEILGDAASLERAFAKSAAAANTFESRMAAVGKSTTKMGKTMTRDVTLPLTALGVASVKMSQNFDLLISRMVGLGGVSEAQSKKFRQFILDLAPKVGKGPDELANGLYQIVSAGVSGKRALEALTVSAKASAAGLGDTATVADAVTSAMNAYAKSGLTAKRAADVLSAAVRDGKGEAADFAPVLGKVVAVASQLGVPFDQAAAALAQMTKLGVPADDAATQLSATFSELLKTTPKAEKALNAMGLSSAGLRQELREKGLLATLETLNEKTKGSTVAMAEAFPNVRALRGVLQLVGTAASGTAQTFDDVKNSTDSLATAWKAASGTDAVKMQKTIAEIKVAAIQLGETLAPLAREIARDVTKVTKAFEDLTPEQKKVLVKFAEMAAVTGPLVLMTGKVITATAAISKLRGGLTGLNAVGPIIVGVEVLIHRKEVGTAIGDTVGAATGSSRLGGLVGSFERNALGLLADPGGTAMDWFSGGGGGDAGKAAAPPSGLSSTQKKELAYAAKYGPGSGITYTWGGVSPITGFDCSGYLMAAYAAAGVTIPHNTVAQFNDPNAIVVLPGAEEPGDGVYFKTDGPGAAPQHVGIYIGGGQFIEYFSRGKPAKIGNLGTAGGYMGARRWMKVAASTGGASGTQGDTKGAADPTYDPLGGKGGKKTPWKGATQATITTAVGGVNAMLKAVPSTLDPIEKNAVAHIEALKKKLQPHMSAADLATTKVELAKWGKVLHTEITKNAREAAAAAAEAKKQFDRALSLDMSNVLRDFDRGFQAKMQAFDRETQRGLAKFVVAQTPEEKALADYIAQRAAEQKAVSDAQQQSDLAAAIASGDPAQIKAAQDAIAQTLEDDHQRALQAAADASRAAADAKTTADQQSYQDQRDAQRQSLQDLNDDQRTALQNNLDDWTGWLDAKQKSYAAFVEWLRSQGIDTSGLIDPNSRVSGAPATGQATATRGGVAAGSYYGTLSPFNPTGMADGAIVTRPTIALVGEGREAEGVFPLSVLGRMLGGGDSKPMTLILELDGQQVAQKTVPYNEGVVRVKLR